MWGQAESEGGRRVLVEQQDAGKLRRAGLQALRPGHQDPVFTKLRRQCGDEFGRGVHAAADGREVGIDSRRREIGEERDGRVQSANRSGYSRPRRQEPSHLEGRI